MRSRFFFRWRLAIAGREAAWAAAAVALLSLALGLWGIGWGLPGPDRLRALPEGALSEDAARRLAESWQRLYTEVRRAHEEMLPAEPVTYARGLEVTAPGWTFPPDNLVGSVRSLLLQSENPDEKKAFIILSQMRPGKLEFRPLYVQYGGAFIYPLGLFLKAASLVGAAVLTPGAAHYLSHPGDMGRLYLLARLFILIFQVGSALVLFDMGRRLSGLRTGLAAAVLFVLSPMVLAHSHVVKPHPYAAFWALAALRWMLLAQESGRPRHYVWAGGAAGVAVGANLALSILMFCPILAWAARCAGGATGGRQWRWAGVGTALAAAVVLGTNPYLAVSPQAFAWELQVYAPMRWDVAPERMWAMVLSSFSSLGVGATLLGLGALFRASWRPGARRILAAVCILGGLVLWGRFSTFAEDPGSLRLFYPFIAVALLLGADWLVSLRPVWGLGLGLLVALETAAGAGVTLENLRRSAGPDSAGRRAAAWIETHVPAGASVGLTRRPEPAHTPAFRYDRYRLMICDRVADLKEPPGWIVVEGAARPYMDSLLQKSYHLAAAFPRYEFAGIRLTSDPFINGAFYIYERGAPGGDAP
ncbi:MAG: hypothetical protein WC881_04475 [Elusimicrobiota bacterium]|jgi:hypothetical protein